MIQPSDLLVSPEALQTRRWLRNLRMQIVACDVLTIPDSDPRRTVQCLIDTVLGLYGAGSAGLSVLRPRRRRCARLRATVAGDGRGAEADAGGPSGSAGR
jgi:hypothetical protein